MKRNGALPHKTTTVLEMLDHPLPAASSPLQAASSPLQAESSPLQAETRLVQTRSRNLNIYQTSTSFERRFMAARLTFEAVLGDPKLAEELASAGYDTPRILQGQAFYQQALALIKQHRVSVGNLFAAADARKTAQEQIHVLYKRHVGLARLALRDDRGAAEKLDLSVRKRTQAGWVFQADQFYSNALTDQAIIAKLATYGITDVQLLTAQQQVAAVADGIVEQQRYKNSAQEIKQARDAALQALNHWMVEFKTVARIALADQPQRLVQLGLTKGK